MRKVLGEDKGHGPYIAVLRGIGYRMSVDVSRSDLEGSTAEPEAVPAQGWYQRSSQTIRATSYWLLGIVAVLALYRPGPLGSGMHITYCECKHGRQEVAYVHESLRPILGETNGCGREP